MDGLLVVEAVALTLVFTKGAIFARVRNVGPAFWRELARCPLCAGVWVGAGWRLLHTRPLVPSLALVADLLASGAVTGVLALLVALLVALLDRWSDPPSDPP